MEMHVYLLDPSNKEVYPYSNAFLKMGFLPCRLDGTLLDPGAETEAERLAAVERAIEADRAPPPEAEDPPPRAKVSAFTTTGGSARKAVAAAKGQ